MFVFGWLFESVADAQKWTWKQVSLGFGVQGSGYAECSTKPAQDRRGLLPSQEGTTERGLKTLT